MRTFLMMIALLTVPGRAPAQSHFTRTNPPGPQPVGLRVVEQYDMSRGYRGTTDPHTGRATVGERARPIQTLIWYPAAKGSGRATNAGDYLRLGGTSDVFPAAPAKRVRLEGRDIDSRVGALAPGRA